MKIFKLNFFWIVLAAILLVVLLLVPSLIIQSIWNSLFDGYLAANLMISVWQAALLWGALLTAIYMSGLVKLQFDIKTLDNIDINEIKDPQLKAELERLRQLRKAEEEKKHKKEDPEA